MPIAPSSLERLAILRLNQGPGPVFDAMGALGFRMVHTAVEVGLFDALAQGARPAEALARELRTDPEATLLLLEALEPLGYVARRGDAWANTAMAATWMVSSSPTGLGPAFPFWESLFAERTATLAQTVRTGRPPADYYAWVEGQPRVSAAFQHWMTVLARITAPEMARKLALPAQGSLLDVGGGHAEYTVQFLQHRPGLRATVVDTPRALQAAEANVARARMQDRITLQQGDFLRAPLGQGHDVALVFNIVHGLSPERNVALLRRVHAALRPGGRVAVLEQLRGKVRSPTGQAVAGMMALTFRHLLGARTYTLEEVQGMLREAGFAPPKRHGLLKAPGASLLVAAKA
jgi:SAM-dependent methyltransferase